MRSRYILLLLFILPVLVNAQQFVYTPINPSFGGSSFNHSWLMSEAEAQNNFTASSSSKSSIYSDTDALTSFEESLNRQILSQLSRQIVTDTFGEAEFEEGTYEIGSYIIEIANDLGGVNINITDITSGSETSIVIPYF